MFARAKRIGKGVERKQSGADGAKMDIKRG